MPAKVEMELIQATKFKIPKGGYPERQDYLAALAKSTKVLTDDQFGALTDEAADWVGDAADAIKAGTDIEDFADADEPEAEDADEAGNDEAADSGDDTADDTGEDADAEDNAEADADAESENEAEEAAQAAKRNKRNKGSAVAASKTKSGGKAAPSAPAPKAAPKKKKEESRYDKVTGAKDRYGCIVGTKTADAVAMYEEGATSAQIRKKLDGRFYNILKALEEKGHRVERLPGGVFRLTHADDLPKKGKK